MDTAKIMLSIDDVDIVTCMSDSPKAKVYLASVKQSTRFVVFKELKGTGIMPLYRRIDELHSQYFPQLYGMWEADGRTMIIEEYISGETLTEKQEKAKLSEAELIDYAIQICSALCVLHHAKPPIIYRDLKPDNVVITEDGALRLVDFDAVREYDAELSRDTVIMGTKEYASPEQFGFTQTDVRSDIYSFGRVFSEALRYTEASGKFALKCRKIIDKATMFDPDKRYMDTDALLTELRTLKGSGKKRLRFLPIMGLGVILLIFVVMWSGHKQTNNDMGETTTPEVVTTPEPTTTPEVTTTSEPITTPEPTTPEPTTAPESTTTTEPMTTIAEEKQQIPEGSIIINEENFPDDVFRAYITDQYDTYPETDGYLTPREINAVRIINVKDMEVTSLKGIEFFPKLEQLNCNLTPITSLDVSKNRALKRLHCTGTNITELDVSYNPKLYNLECCSLMITTLDLRYNPELTNVFIGESLIETLDVSRNPLLEQLDIGSTNITNIDVSKNVRLRELNCSYSEVESLDLSNNPLLEELNCRDTNVTALDLSSNPKLKLLDCAQNSISELDVSNNPELQYLHCGDTLVEALNLGNNLMLTNLDCYRTDITELDLSRNTRLEVLHCASLNLKELDLSNNPRLKDLDMAKIKSFSELDLSNNLKLTRMICSNTALSGLDLSRHAMITEFECAKSNLELIKLNIGQVGCSYKLSNIEKFDIQKTSGWKDAVYNNGVLTELGVGDITIECSYDLDNGNAARIIFYAQGTGEHTYINGECTDCGAKKEG